jgi:hypothetical protein
MKIELPLIPSDDLKTIISCLNLTQSDNDHEALNAVRGANRVMARLGVTWKDVFAKIIDQLNQETAAQKPVEPTIQDALEKLLEVLKPNSFRELILDYKTQLKSKGYLSKKQRDVIYNALKKQEKYYEWNDNYDQ